MIDRICKAIQTPPNLHVGRARQSRVAGVLWGAAAPGGRGQGVRYCAGGALEEDASSTRYTRPLKLTPEPLLRAISQVRLVEYPSLQPCVLRCSRLAAVSSGYLQRTRPVRGRALVLAGLAAI